MLLESPTNYVLSRTYRDFDHLVSDMRQWDLDLKQIDRGPFCGKVLQFGVSDVHITEGRFGRVLDQKGAPPAGLRTIGIPAAQDMNFIWRGQRVAGNNLIVFPDGAELASVSSTDFHIYTCSFPTELLASLSEKLQIAELDQLRDGNEVIHCNSYLINRLQECIRTLCDSVRREEMLLSQQNNQHQIRFELPQQILQTIAASEGVCIPAMSRKREDAVTRARSYIELNANEPISVKDICKAVGVSQRTLEYAFDEAFGLPPKAFLLTYRLNLVRKELREPDNSTAKVVDIANSCGFWHMGRFAAHYCRQFDELPSETQRNAIR